MELVDTILDSVNIAGLQLRHYHILYQYLLMILLTQQRHSWYVYAYAHMGICWSSMLFGGGGRGAHAVLYVKIICIASHLGFYSRLCYDDSIGNTEFVPCMHRYRYHYVEGWEKYFILYRCVYILLCMENEL